MQPGPKSPSPSRLRAAFVAALAALAFLALVGVRHHGAIAAYTLTLDDPGWSVLAATVAGLAVLSGIAAALLRPRGAAAACVAGIAVPALLFAVDPVFAGRTAMPGGRGLGLALAPVGTLSDLHRREAEQETASLRRSAAALADSEARLRAARDAGARERDDWRNEAEEAAAALERSRLEVDELLRRTDTLEAEAANLRERIGELGALEAANRELRAKLDTARAAAADQAEALKEAKARALRLEARVADLEALMRVQESR